MIDLILHAVYIGMILVAFVGVYLYAWRKAYRLASQHKQIAKSDVCVRTLTENSKALDRIDESAKKVDSAVIVLPKAIADAIEKEGISERHARRVLERLAIH